MRNIVLTGLSGSGKTTLSRRLAERLDMQAVDTDGIIEREAGMPVRDIFVRYGEAHFRELEMHAACEAARMRDVVVATGGGMVLRDENMRVLRETGLAVFLDRPVESILGDLECEGRPLLQNGAAQLRKMAEERRVRYLATCDVVFNNTGPLEEAVPALLALVRGETLEDGYEGYAVIGDPIGHTLSPRIQAATLSTAGLRTRYEAMFVKCGGLARFIGTARKTGLRGFNVTIPHKGDIIPLLDEVDPEARRCGAVNTVVKRGGKLCGYNTDMPGLLLAVRDKGRAYKDSRVLILGTGGAARGAALKAALEGAAQVTLLGRRMEAAEQIRDALRGEKTAVKLGDFSEASLRAHAAGCDILISCVPLGMKGFGADFPSLDFLEALPGHALVTDLVYTPPRTGLLKRARELGLDTLNGLPMLIYQAIIADEYFLGRTLDRRALYKAALGALGPDYLEKE